VLRVVPGGDESERSSLDDCTSAGRTSEIVAAKPRDEKTGTSNCGAWGAVAGAEITWMEHEAGVWS
jgi:hypothetical protein